MGKVIKLAASDGHGLAAYRADPPEPKGGVVVLQEAFGVNAHIRSVCDAFAAHGYAAIAPALYDRQQKNAAFGYDPDSAQQALALRRKLVYADALRDIAAAVTSLRVQGRVGAVGYCVGGSAAWLAAAHLAVDAAACYYASDIGKQLDERPRCPVIMHFAERDHIIPMEHVEKFRTAHPEVPVHVYAAAHGFDCTARPSTHDAPSAALALERTLALFAAHVARA
ncbi:MAG: dienelactone hydrolase family protein [Rhizobiales bacterium]|nr:dienelactone hydrolase family protein [Hyphomicrobiales bacterium]